jgi:hypothetical protein
MRRWSGHGVILYSTMVPFGGKPVRGLRVRMPAAKRQGGGSSLRRK